MSGALSYDYLAKDDTRPISQTVSNWLNVQKQQYDVKQQQATEAQGQALQQAIDPATGQFNQAKYNQILATNPRAAMGAGTAARGGVALDTDTYNLHNARLNSVMSAMGQLIADHPDGVPADAMHSIIDSFHAQGRLTDQEAQQEHAQVSNDPRANSRLVLQGLGAGMSTKTALDAVKPQPTLENTGGQIVPLQVSPQLGAAPGSSVTQGSGGAPLTLTPQDVYGKNAMVEFNADQNYVSKHPGTTLNQKILRPYADVVTEMGGANMLPGGAIIHAPVYTGGSGGGGGVPGGATYNGQPVSSTNIPHLSGQGGVATPATPAAPTGPPAPPGAPAGASPYTGGGIGTVLSRPAAPAPRSDLGGGATVASINPLYTPSTGAAAPPSPAVSGDVAAILGGMRRAAATRGGGPQVAGDVAIGAGGQEQAANQKSAELLAAHDVAAAAYPQTSFPYTQALSLLGRGMVTAPTSDQANAFKGWANGVARSFGISEPFDSTKEYDALHKYLSQIVSNNPIAAGSDARLAEVLAGNANTGIHELASADMVKAGIALQRMTFALDNSWHTLGTQGQAQYGGSYLNYLKDQANKIDVRAFGFDLYNPEQRKTLQADLQAQPGAEGRAARQKFLDTLAMARNARLIGAGGIKAMP